MKPVANPLPSAVASGSRPKRPRRSPYRTPPGRPATHGGAVLTRVLRTVKLDTIDKRSQVGCALRRIREDLIAQVGGVDQVTPELSGVIDQGAIKAVITQAVGE